MVKQGVVLVGSPYRLSGCAAGVVVVAGRGRGDWSSGGASRLLGGLRAWLHLARRLGHPDRDQAREAYRRLLQIREFEDRVHESFVAGRVPSRTEQV